MADAAPDLFRAVSVDDAKAGLLIVLSIYLCTWVLHLLLPAYERQGYACDATGSPLTYRLNGFLVMSVVLAATVVLRTQGLISGGELALHANGAALSAVVLGILFSAYMVFVRGGRLEKESIDLKSRCLTTDDPWPRPATPAEIAVAKSRGAFGCFYTGLEWNPRIGDVGWGFSLSLLFVCVDLSFLYYAFPRSMRQHVKMWLYMVGATLLELILFSQLCLNSERRGDRTVSLPMICYFSLFTFFCVEYLSFEVPHLYTYDLFAERVGFKLAWGCLAFYPFFYSIGGWALVANPHAELSPLTCASLCLLFFVGYAFTRGANMQKYYAKTKPTEKHCFGGLIQQRYITAPGGRRLIVSGFWALSRHINYLGEIIQAVALALLCSLATGALLPWLYPLYYVALFIPRQIEDDKLCQAKYGPLWRTYVQLVPYRIVPGVY